MANERRGLMLMVMQGWSVGGCNQLKGKMRRGKRTSVEKQLLHISMAIKVSLQ
jgi:hypothetical protein